MEAIVLHWPGGQHAFRLALGQIEALQQATDCGPEFILSRINLSQWKVADLSETIRLGLIGGGMEPLQAQTITHNAFERFPLITFKSTAQAVIAAALYGPPDDVVGEPLPVEGPTPGDQKTDDGSSPATTA